MLSSLDIFIINKNPKEITVELIHLAKNNNEKVASLEDFLLAWDNEYKAQTMKIPLFNENITSQWTTQQKQYFVKILYHQRAHFDDVLWYLGNFAPNSMSREMILDNIRDEFGKNGRSHEQLYLDFAKDMGVDLTFELLEEKYYLPFIMEYNKGQLKWFREHDWPHCWSAFAALERLDNVDYSNLKNTVESFKMNKVDLLFFKVHIHVTHFERIEQGSLLSQWESDCETIKKVFIFIGNSQISIWKKISDTIQDY